MLNIAAASSTAHALRIAIPLASLPVLPTI
jgi:hypothetical protein